MSDIKRKFIAAIEVTGDPMAPVALQEAYSSICRIAKIIAGSTNEGAVQNIATRLLQDFPNNEINDLSSQPQFIVALCGLLAQALVSYKEAL